MNASNLVRQTARTAITQQILGGPILRTLLKFSAPNLLNFAAIAIIVTFDGVFLGKLGQDTLAGASLVFPLFMLMQHTALGAIGGSVASAVARALGAGRHEHAEAIAAQAALIAVAMALLFVAIELLFGSRIFRAMGGTGATLEAAQAYARTIFLLCVGLWLVNVLGSVVRGTGQMVLPAAVFLGCALGHAVLSPLLIFGAGPIPALGVAGAGIGLAGSFLIGAVVLLIHLRSAHAAVRLRAEQFRPNRTALAEILGVGIPAAFNTWLFNIGVMLLTGVAATFGTAAVAGYGMGIRIEYILMPLTFVLGTSLVTMVGTNVGAGQISRATQIAWVGSGVAAVVSGAIGIGIACFPRAWIGLFTSDPLVLEIGARYARIVGPFYAFFALGLSLYFAFQGGGRLLWPVAAGLLRLLVAVGGGWVAIHWLRGGLTGFFVAIAVGFTVYAAVNVLALRAGAWYRRHS
jgi:putative MATE family efflux protein